MSAAGSRSAGAVTGAAQHAVGADAHETAQRHASCGGRAAQPQALGIRQKHYVFKKGGHALIQRVIFPRHPMTVGESRQLAVQGDSPFQVSISCFVDEPPPPGFRPCEQCRTHSLAAEATLDVYASPSFWRGRIGYFSIHIIDRLGDSTDLRIEVQP